VREPAKKKQQPGSDKSWVNCCCPKIGLPTTSVACNGGEEAGKRKAAEGRGALTGFFLRRLYITGDYGSSESSKKDEGLGGQIVPMLGRELD